MTITSLVVGMASVRYLTITEVDRGPLANHVCPGPVRGRWLSESIQAALDEEDI